MAGTGGVTQCASRCGSGEFVFGDGCVKKCPEGTYAADYFCNASCVGARRYQLESSCAFSCPEFVEKSDTAEIEGAGARWVCVSACPYFWRLNEDEQRECVDVCGDAEFFDARTRECVAVCPSRVVMGQACLESSGDCMKTLEDDGLTRCFCADGEI